VIAPWSEGFNGPLDTRIRIAVEVLKRYPWVGVDKAVMAAPDFIYNSHWSIQDDGTILIPPTNDWMCGDLSQRAWSIVQGLTSYYRYSGDPIAFVYIPLTIDYILDYAQTPPNDDWPLFPISTPTQGKAYGQCEPGVRNQLDLCAIVGRETVRAYKLTADPRYLEAAKRWADVLAEKCDLDPSQPPWNRYTHPEVVDWSDELTGTTTIICEFLDAVIALGHTGRTGPSSGPGTPGYDTSATACCPAGSRTTRGDGSTGIGTTPSCAASSRCAGTISWRIPMHSGTGRRTCGTCSRSS